MPAFLFSPPKNYHILHLLTAMLTIITLVSYMLLIANVQFTALPCDDKA